MTAIATTTDADQLPVTMVFGNLSSFEFLQRTAKAFANSTMVPTAYQAMVTKGYGQRQTTEPNPAAVSNCMIALDMAQRMNANPLQIMQNLHVIEGRPSWSSQFIIAAINASGKFSPLRFDMEDLGEMDATYATFDWEDGRKVEKKHKVRIKNARCIAWAIEKSTGERLESAPVTIEMAVNEGWYGKNGSKWRSMPDLMLRYRSAAFFGRIYAPELLMGLPTSEEVQDVVVQDADGTVHVATRAVPPSAGTVNADTGEVTPSTYPAADFDKNVKAWAKAVASGKKTLADVLATVATKGELTDEQKQRLQQAVAELSPQDVTPKPAADAPAPPPTEAPAAAPADDAPPWAPTVDPDQIAERMRAAVTLDELYDAANLMDALPDDPAQRKPLENLFDERVAALKG